MVLIAVIYVSCPKILSQTDILYCIPYDLASKTSGNTSIPVVIEDNGT